MIFPTSFGLTASRSIEGTGVGEGSGVFIGSSVFSESTAGLETSGGLLFPGTFGLPLHPDNTKDNVIASDDAITNSLVIIISPQMFYVSEPNQKKKRTIEKHN